MGLKPLLFQNVIPSLKTGLWKTWYDPVFCYKAGKPSIDSFLLMAIHKFFRCLFYLIKDLLFSQLKILS